MLEAKILHTDVFLKILTNFTLNNLSKIFENFICYQLRAGEQAECVDECVDGILQNLQSFRPFNQVLPRCFTTYALLLLASQMIKSVLTNQYKSINFIQSKRRISSGHFVVVVVVNP